MTKATVRALAGVRLDPIGPGTLLGLDRLGLAATGQPITSHTEGGEEVVVEARPVLVDDDESLLCTGCGAMGRRVATAARLLAHTPTADRLTRLVVGVPRIACGSWRRVCRLDMSAAADPRSVLTHGALAWALHWVAVDNMAVSRVAAHLGVGWDTLNTAVLDAGLRALGDTDARLAGVRVLGVDEHVWRHRHGQRYVTVIIDLTPVRDGTGPARLLDMVAGRSKKALASWLAERDPAWREQVEVVAMDGFTGYKSATTQALGEQTRVVTDPFHVVKLAGEALDETRRRVRHSLTARRATTKDALYRARRTLLSGADLLTDRQQARLDALFADQRHTAAEVTWALYQRVRAAYHHQDRAQGKRPVDQADRRDHQGRADRHQ